VPRAGSPPKANRLHVGPLGAADQVIDDEARVLEIQRNWRKLIGVEMETYAVYPHDDGGDDPAPVTGAQPTSEDADGDGLSPVAIKWMRRNDLDIAKLSKLFSLGLDEIELVAKKVPGKNTKDRMRSVLLLTCVASYLSTGASRAKHDAVKQACVHYDAYDMANFAAYLVLEGSRRYEAERVQPFGGRDDRRHGAHHLDGVPDQLRGDSSRDRTLKPSSPRSAVRAPGETREGCS
jgi:hypothetical protein